MPLFRSLLNLWLFSFQNVDKRQFTGVWISCTEPFKDFMPPVLVASAILKDLFQALEWLN